MPYWLADKKWFNVPVYVSAEQSIAIHIFSNWSISYEVQMGISNQIQIYNRYLGWFHVKFRWGSVGGVEDFGSQGLARQLDLAELVDGAAIDGVAWNGGLLHMLS